MNYLRMQQIEINRHDHGRLLQLANALLSIKPELGEHLLAKVSGAKLVDRAEDMVQIGSMLLCKTDEGPSRRVTLVYPEQANISLGAVSVHTPVGVALLGMRVGDTAEFTGNDGRVRQLRLQGLKALPQTGHA